LLNQGVYLGSYLACKVANIWMWWFFFLIYFLSNYFYLYKDHYRPMHYSGILRSNHAAPSMHGLIYKIN
jgi:hypothetical protein